MIVLGLTGSVGMGKSTTAALFAAEGIPVFDADAAVHRLYGGSLAPAIGAAFPGVVVDGSVDRQLLAERLADPQDLARLEALVHPAVRDERRRFLADAAATGAWLVVLDIPLLYETGGDREVDAVLVVSASEAVQKERVLARPGMTAERLARIMARQLPDHEKRRRARFNITTENGVADARRQVSEVIALLEVDRARDRF